MEKKNPEPTQSTEAGRRPRSYQKPRLTRFGQLSEITKAVASGALVDGGKAKTG